MPVAVSLQLVRTWTHSVPDPEQIRREREESRRLLAAAHDARARAEQVALKVRRMNALYRERLVGNRDPE